jgi:hypothetical protein
MWRRDKSTRGRAQEKFFENSQSGYIFFKSGVVKKFLFHFTIFFFDKKTIFKSQSVHPPALRERHIPECISKN